MNSLKSGHLDFKATDTIIVSPELCKPAALADSKYHKITFGISDNNVTIYPQLKEAEVRTVRSFNERTLDGMPIHYESYKLHFENDIQTDRIEYVGEIFKWTEAVRLSITGDGNVAFVVQRALQRLPKLKELTIEVSIRTWDKLLMRSFLKAFPALGKAAFVKGSSLEKEYFDKFVLNQAFSIPAEWVCRSTNDIFDCRKML